VSAGLRRPGDPNEKEESERLVKKPKTTSSEGGKTARDPTLSNEPDDAADYIGQEQAEREECYGIITTRSDHGSQHQRISSADAKYE
jgi:hypothetical protein